MAYPFAQAPTVGQVVEAAERIGAALGKLRTGLEGPRGATVVEFLEIDEHCTEPLPEDFDERVGWDTIRRWCRQLRISPGDLDLGLDLD